MEKKKLKFCLEGPDGSGKSTVHKMLKEVYPDLDIVDRSILSDIVYAKKFDRTEYMGVPIQTYLDYWKYWHKANVDLKIVLFTASPETLALRALDKKEDFCRNRTFEQIKDYLKLDDIAFQEEACKLYNEFGFEFTTVDTDRSTKDTFEQIKDFINGRFWIQICS